MYSFRFCLQLYEATICYNMLLQHVAAANFVVKQETAINFVAVIFHSNSSCLAYVQEVRR